MSYPDSLPANMRAATIEVVENTLYVHCAETGDTLIRLALPVELDARSDNWRVTTNFKGELEVSKDGKTAST